MDVVATLQEYWPHAVAGGTVVAAVAAFLKMTQEMEKLRLEKKKLLLEIDNLIRQEQEKAVLATHIRIATLEETTRILGVRGLPRVVASLYASDRERNDPRIKHLMLPPQPIPLITIFGLFALPAWLVETYAPGVVPQAWWLAPAFFVALASYWLRISEHRTDWAANVLAAAQLDSTAE